MNRAFTILLLFLCASISSLLYAQEKVNTDSLINVLNTSKNDTSKVNLLANICFAIQDKDHVKAIQYGEEGVKLANQLNYGLGSSNCQHSLGIVHYYQGHYDKSLENYLASLRTLEKLLDEEKNKNSPMLLKLVAMDLHDIGKVYWRQNLHKKALESFNRSLSIFLALNDQRGASGCYNNMSGVYQALGDHDKVYMCLQKFLAISKASGNKIRIATGLNNLGMYYSDQGKTDQALSYMLEAYKIRTEIDDIKGIAYSCTDLGAIYFDLKDYKKALAFQLKGLEYAKKSNSKERIKASYESLSKIYGQLKQYEKAYEYQQLFSQLKDSLFNDQSLSKLAEMSEKYESEKKEQQIELLKKAEEARIHELARIDAEAKKQQVLKLAFASGFVLVLALGLVILRGYRQKQKSHQLMQFQKSVIEEKNKEILDSIHYAKRIQEALLKEEEHKSSHLPPHFILFKPKDIVSGDFYWAIEKQNHWYLAVADCTGHGVPGAFMSMLGIAFLNEINASQELLTPAQVLDQLREKIVSELRQGGKAGGNKDGMDISLLRYDLDTQKMIWAGANNPLWLIDETSGSKLTEIKADKQPIGYHPEPKPFTDHHIDGKPGLSIYLFSDGYADQFGGVKGKKFKYSQMKELVLSAHGKSMLEQKELFTNTLDRWKGRFEQVDDICLIGMRVEEKEQLANNANQSWQSKKQNHQLTV